MKDAPCCYSHTADRISSSTIDISLHNVKEFTQKRPTLFYTMWRNSLRHYRHFAAQCEGIRSDIMDTLLHTVKEFTEPVQTLLHTVKEFTEPV